MYNRRDFLLSLAAVPALTSGLRLVLGHTDKTISSEEGFPVGNYTPYGYLDNPFHSWNLHRSGIVRSTRGIGFGFYYPAGPGGYFEFIKNEIYEAHLRLGFLIAGRRRWLPEDFAADQLTSSYHSKNLFTYVYEDTGVQLDCTFLQVGEHALAAYIAAQGTTSQSIRLLAVAECKLGAAVWWGAMAWRASTTQTTMRSVSDRLLLDRYSRCEEMPQATGISWPKTVLICTLGSRGRRAWNTG